MTKKLELLDYSSLYELVEGRRQVLVLVGFMVLMVATLALALGMTLNETHAVDLEFVQFLVVLLLLLVVAITGLVMGSWWGYYLGAVFSFVFLLAFPLGTFFGLEGLTGLRKTKLIYLDETLNFKQLRVTYRQHQ